MNVKDIIFNWLDDRYDAFVNLGCDEGADDPDDYAVEEIENYADCPDCIVDDYIEEVIKEFNDDEFFVLDNRADIAAAVSEWYRDRGYIK